MLLGVVDIEVMAVMLTAKGSTFTSIILMLFLISLHNAHMDSLFACRLVGILKAIQRKTKLRIFVKVPNCYMTQVAVPSNHRLLIY